MLSTFSLLLELAGLVLLILGYRKANRNLMLAAALCLWLGAGIPDFARGFLEGAQAGQG